MLKLITRLENRNFSVRFTPAVSTTLQDSCTELAFPQYKKGAPTIAVAHRYINFSGFTFVLDIDLF